ncbi:isocitrate lyase/phosphoenolpyruvate mutase family protein [Streptomyces sp. NPDC045431]|uniref:isocitrate lyase/PEP mutase family protein n=1 Tax=Streptomyces sp. NPDC045431 TaxID=3155613 RepID=UPI0033E6092F
MPSPPSQVSPSPVAAFRSLHHDRAPGDPLVLPGPWDAASARAFEAAGFPALATPSAGVAASLGYEDGATPADEMFAAVSRIARSVSVPVSADVEGGYGLPPKQLVARVLETGAVGVNLEDSEAGALKDPHRHAEWLAEVRAEAGDALFLNARVDTYVRGLTGAAALADAITRSRLYAEAGADCVYPILIPPDHLPPLRAEITAPVNALSKPDGPPPAELGRLGATRVTFGPGLLHRTLAEVRRIAEEVGG